MEKEKQEALDLMVGNISQAIEDLPLEILDDLPEEIRENISEIEACLAEIVDIMGKIQQDKEITL